MKRDTMKIRGKKLAAHIRQSERHLLHENWVIYDRKLIIRHVNKAAAELLRYPAKDIIGKSMARFFPPVTNISRANYLQVLKREAQTPHVGVLMQVNPRKLFAGSFVPVQEKKGLHAGMVCQRLDDTFQRATISVNMHRMERNMGKVSLDALATLDAQGRVIGTNEVFAYSSALPRLQVFGKQFSEFFVPGSFSSAEENIRSARAKMMEHERANTAPWDVCYTADFSRPDWAKDWLLEKHLRTRVRNGSLTLYSPVETTFMIFKTPFISEEWDLAWEGEVSYPSFGFFFCGTDTIRDGRSCTPDVNGYNLGLLTPNDPRERHVTPQLKRTAQALIFDKAVPRNERIRLRSEKSGGVLRIFIDGALACEYADAQHKRYSRGRFTGCLASFSPMVIHSLRLFRRPAERSGIAVQPGFDLVFNGSPHEVFEAEFFQRRIWSMVTTDVYLHRVTELREAQAELMRLMARQEENLSRIRHDLMLAGRLVERMVPREMPVLPGVRFAAHFKPSDEIGGDLFDLIPLEGNRVVVLLYDVSGHGVSAALISVMTRTLFQKGFVPDEPILPQVEAINRELRKIIGETHFVAYFCGILNLNDKSLRYVGGGLPYPAVMGAERLVLLESHGAPLGLLDMLNVTEKNLSLISGDRLLLFTDGLYEIFDEKGDMYGRKRLIEFAGGLLHLGIGELVPALVSEHLRYLNSAPAGDDVTLLGIEIL